MIIVDEFRVFCGSFYLEIKCKHKPTRAVFEAAVLLSMREENGVLKEWKKRRSEAMNRGAYI